MSRLPVGVRAVRGFARLVAFAYPVTFRQTHAGAFADVAQHLWERASARTSPARATLDTIRVLLADTINGCSIVWAAAIRDDRAPASAPRLLARRVGQWLGGGGHDLRLAGRAARRAPAFTLLVILTLGLGIGVSAAAFDALDRTVIRPLPFRNSDRLVFLAIKNVRLGYWTSLDPDLMATWRRRATRLEQIEVFLDTTIIWHGDQGAERLEAIGVSGGLPGMLSVRPIAGRLLQPADAEPDAAPAVMLTEQMWRDRFGADPAVVGRSLALGASPRPTTVVGIWPAGARLDMTGVPDFISVLPKGREYVSGSFVYHIARMSPAAAIADVEAELAAVTPPNGDQAGVLVPDAFSPAEMKLGAPFVRGVWLVFAGGIGLLIVAVMNAGHLLLGRATARSHELGVRLALGGSSLRLMRLFVAEGTVYVAGGIGTGIGFMMALEGIIHRYEPRLFMTLDGAGPGGRAFWFICLAATAATMACAAAPLLGSRASDFWSTIGRANIARTTGRGSRAMTGLIVIQGALAVVLVCGAAVMVRSFQNLMAVDTGIAIRELATISVAAPAARYPTPELQAAYIQQVEDALKGLPTVTGVTTAPMPLLSTSIQAGLPYLDGEEKPRPDDAAVTGLASVPLNYFDVTGTRVVTGRGFRPDDAANVAVVNESFAASRGGNVIGRRVFTPASRTSFEIVGIVSDVRTFGLADDQRRDSIYFPDLRPARNGFARFFVRTTGDPAIIVREARARITAVDRAVPMFAPETGLEVLRRQSAQHRFVAVLLVGLAILSCGLALAGVYGAVSLDVSRRTREIGVRMALGATRRVIVRAVVGGGLRPVVPGALIGVVGAWLALPFVEVLLYRVGPRDPGSTLTGVSVVAAAAALSAWVPARRASRIDPAVQLRQ